MYRIIVMIHAHIHTILCGQCLHVGKTFKTCHELMPDIIISTDS